MDGMSIVDTFYSLVNPGCGFSANCTQVHGISKKDVKDAPTFGKLWETIGERLSTHTLISYNASFDLYALERALYLADIDAPNLRYGCAYKLTKSLLTVPSYSLTSIAEGFNIKYQAHNALADAQTTAAVIQCIADTYGAQSFEQLMDIARLPYEYTWLNAYDPSSPSSNIKKYGRLDSSPSDPIKHGSSDFFNGKNVVFTGNLTFASRDAAQQAVVEMGGICKSCISRKVEIVVVGFYDPSTMLPGRSTGMKLQAAQDLIDQGCKIIIINENDFMSILRHGLA